MQELREGAYVSSGRGPGNRGVLDKCDGRYATARRQMSRAITGSRLIGRCKGIPRGLLKPMLAELCKIAEIDRAI